MAQENHDVIVIGAGFAGMAAARELGWRGKRVLVLEGKDRIGGRAWYSDLNGVPIELGGGYVHWSQPHTWGEISRYGLEVIERPYYAPTNAMQKTRFLLDGELRDEFTPAEAAQIKAAFADYVAPAKDVFPNPHRPLESDAYKAYDHLSAEDRINQMGLTPLQRATLLRTAGMQANNAPREGGYVESLRWYALANCNDETYAASLTRFTLAEGTAGLLDRMRQDAGAEVVLNARVSEVSDHGDSVKVVASTGTYSAARCIVATGVNVWKHIRFSPGVSKSRMDFSREELSGKGGKIYVQLKGKFVDSRWSAIGGALLAVLPHVISDEASVVVAFTNPEHPMNAVTKEALQREIDKFDDSYEVVDFKHHDWVEDDLVAGTWGNFRPGQWSKYFDDALKPEGNIHFAGSDIAHGWRGFFDGALESGIRVGRSVS